MTISTTADAALNEEITFIRMCGECGQLIRGEPGDPTRTPRRDDQWSACQCGQRVLIDLSSC